MTVEELEKVLRGDAFVHHAAKRESQCGVIRGEAFQFLYRRTGIIFLQFLCGRVEAMGEPPQKLIGRVPPAKFDIGKECCRYGKSPRELSDGNVLFPPKVSNVFTECFHLSANVSLRCSTLSMLLSIAVLGDTRSWNEGNHG